MRTRGGGGGGEDELGYKDDVRDTRERRDFSREVNDRARYTVLNCGILYSFTGASLPDKRRARDRRREFSGGDTAGRAIRKRDGSLS